ncbi:hypothetical protein MPSYJ_48350 [Mycolicibacterium psychrotolerans]|uniref:PE-PPE domain-containing protein n=1 Tax=Mycolicibacterium psychrotolerans TaxID=216929 RepID=A0A7I7MGB4_9MYCO|nr:hypothetical protein MPSYJ_48350 [Mycolicibacterium psychrotolerans]
MADFPDRWWNLLAVANAVAGSIFVHVPVMFADLSTVPAENIDVDLDTKGGITTHYLVPTEKLPLVRLFPSLASREAELKAAIDAGYSRNDPAPAGKLASLVTGLPAIVNEPAPQADAPTEPDQGVQPVETAADEETPADETTTADEEPPADETAPDDEATPGDAAATDTEGEDGDGAENGDDSADTRDDEDPADSEVTPVGDPTDDADDAAAKAVTDPGSAETSEGADIPEVSKPAS